MPVSSAISARAPLATAVDRLKQDRCFIRVTEVDIGAGGGIGV
ncbi:MAG: hypothetical protein ACOY4H_02310 [Thermodesulfobacteriota bacterium]